jgi:hypothetical protein
MLARFSVLLLDTMAENKPVNVEETVDDDNLHDELDFYDFLEVISDKIDGITRQSTAA